MSLLLTQCPFCQTTFKVSDAQLQIANGVVRCGSCMEVFLATQHRVILKDKPSPLSRQQPAAGLSVEFPDSQAPVGLGNDIYSDSINDTDSDSYNDTDNDSYNDTDDDYADTFTGSSESGWQVVDAPEEPEPEDNAVDDSNSENDDDDDDEFDDFDINEPALGDGRFDDTDEDIHNDIDGDIDDDFDDEFDDDDADDDIDDDDVYKEDDVYEDDTDDTEEVDDADDDDNENLSEADDFDDDLDELPPQHADFAEQDNAFTSWEAEEAFRAANDPVEPDTEALKDDDLDIAPHAESPDTDSNDEESEDSSIEPDQPSYGGMLNPTGYAITSFSVDHVLPKSSAIDEALENDPAMWDAPDEIDAVDELDEPDVSDEHVESAGQDKKIRWDEFDEPPEDSFPAYETIEEAVEQIPDTEQDGIPEGEQFPIQPAAARTAVIVPNKGDSIPTLVPDVVASETIPAGGLGAQTMAWLQSFRQSFQDTSGQEEDYSGTDEKAEIRSNLSGLRHEDSLEPVASEALDVFDDDPVELPYNLEQWPSLKTAGMIAASVFLVGALVLQYAWFNLDTLVLERRMSGITGLLCTMADCPDTQVIDLSSLVTEELVVRSHPSVEDALQVNFIFRNDRNREQPFPLVELNFTDIDGEIIANRVFTSEEYMPDEMQLFTHMPAHSSIQVSLDLVDPGDQATGYSLVFRNP